MDFTNKTTTLIFVIIILLTVLSLTYFYKSCYQPTLSDCNCSSDYTDIKNNYPEKFTPEKTHKLCLYYAPWCGHCKNLKPTWEELKKELKDGTIEIIDYNCDTNSECKKNNISGFPTIIFHKKCGDKVLYRGDRSLKSLLDFIKTNSN